MRTPILLLAGQAGVGKDEVGKHLWKTYGAVTIAQADPLKRFAQSVFGFSEWQLWGPSHARNLADTRYDNKIHLQKVLKEVGENFNAEKDTWLNDICVGQSPEQRKHAATSLYRWFIDLVNGVGIGNGLTPRKVLQSLGDEFGRQVDQTIWSRYALRVANQLLDNKVGFSKVGALTYSRTEGVYFELGAAKPKLVVITDGRYLNEIKGVQAVNGVAINIQRPDSNASKDAENAGIKGHRSERELMKIPFSAYDGVIVNGPDKTGDPWTLEDLYSLVDDAVKAFYPELTTR